MTHQDPHRSDQELLLYADGEMGSRSASQVRDHLDACWSCRARLRELEQTIGDFVHARDSMLASRVLPTAGPRALFRARLAQAASLPAKSVIWKLAPAAAVVFSAILAVIVVFSGAVSRDVLEPRISLTPGETRPVSVGEVCSSSGAVSVREIPLETRRRVFEEYGVSPNRPNAYEVDYLITPELGGADSIRNLWPQPYSTRWNALVKDQLEQRLHQLVCQGKLDLATAQRDISTDWIGAYKKYFGSNAPR